MVFLWTDLVLQNIYWGAKVLNPLLHICPGYGVQCSSVGSSYIQPQLLQSKILSVELWTTSALCCVVFAVSQQREKELSLLPQGCFSPCIYLPVMWIDSCRLTLDVKKPQTWTSAQRYPRKQICYCAIEKIFPVSFQALSVGFRY